MSGTVLPAGRVTFLMTDVERSTRLWEENAAAMAAAVERHDALIAAVVRERGGVLVRDKGEGDSSFSVFERAPDAAVAAVEIQRALQREPWPQDTIIRIRAALNTGEAQLREDDYYGIEPNRCARLRAVAYGGQTVCSQATWELIAGRLPAEVSLRDLGLHRLRDLSRAERVFQICHPDLRSEFPPLRSLGVRHNLPAQRTSFVGRHEDLTAVRKHLQVDRLLTLTGVGGCGKTRLAIEAASDQLETFPDGVFFADLSPVSDPHVVASALAAAVGFSRLALGTASGRPATELLDFLSSRHVLIVLDNCEHVIEACADLVDEILDRCPLVHVLATSREALAVQGEQTYPVRPLGMSDDGFPDASDAVRLFHERASSVRPGFAVSADNVEDVVEICRRLDGLPLAIELAAAQITHLSPRQIVDRLGDRLRSFVGGRRRSERQQTLQGALDWSHDLLSDDERVALRRVSVFPGSFSLEAADDVLGDLPALDAMSSLVAKSLVLTEHAGESHARYRLLETVRVYADGKLADAGERELSRDRHRDHFLAWAEALPAEETYLDPRGSIQREAHNLRAALAWSQSRGRADLVGRIASTMNRIWIGDIREGRRWLAIGTDAVDDLAPEHRVRVLAVAAHVAVLAIQAFDGELARKAVEASEGRAGMWSSLAHSLLCLNTGIRFFFSKDASLAQETERLGQAAVRLAPGPVSRGLAWFWVAQARVLLGDLDGAVEGFENGASEGSEGDMSFACLGLLAGTLHVAGRHEEAHEAAKQVLRRARVPTGGLWAWALYCALPYALTLGEQGRHGEAVDFVRDLIDEGGVPRTPGVMTSVVVVLAALAAQRDDFETASVLLEHAGQAMVTSGIRTPVDIALHGSYLAKVRAKIDPGSANAHRERGRSMPLDDALAYGLHAPELSSAF